MDTMKPSNTPSPYCFSSPNTRTPYPLTTTLSLQPSHYNTTITTQQSGGNQTSRDSTTLFVAPIEERCDDRHAAEEGSRGVLWDEFTSIDVLQSDSGWVRDVTLYPRNPYPHYYIPPTSKLHVPHTLTTTPEFPPIDILQSDSRWVRDVTHSIPPPPRTLLCPPTSKRNLI